MARGGEVIEDPYASVRVRFLQTARDSQGELLRLQCLLGPHAAPPGAGIPHVHPYQTERIEVLSGTLQVRVGWRRRTLRAGEVAEVPPGTPHGFRNGGGEEARVMVEFRPALKTQEAFEVLFALGREQELTGIGVPGNPLLAAVLLDEYKDEVRAAWVPEFAQRASVGALASVGRLLGYRVRRP